MMEMGTGKMLFYMLLRAISSGGERFLHTEEVAGSKPASPTIPFVFKEKIKWLNHANLCCKSLKLKNKMRPSLHLHC